MLQFAVLWFLVRVAGRFPAWLIDIKAVVLGTLAWYLSPRLRRVTDDHMRHVLGPTASPRARARAARGCVRTAARNYAAFARAPYLTPEQQFAPIEVMDGADRFFGAVDRGCGVIAVSSHLGNPEAILRALGRSGLAVMVFIERLSPSRMHDWVRDLRGAPGLRLVTADLAGAREALTHVRAGGVLVVLADRDLLGTGRPVMFFGERARLPSGPVELALRTGAPLLPVTVLRSPRGGLRVIIDEPLTLTRTGGRDANIEAGMRAMAAALETGIRRAPDQWFALSPIWQGLTL